jgi:hypothetical protein
VLRGDGLGIVLFGDPMARVIAVLTDLFGDPSGDSIQESPFGYEDETPSKIASCNTATGYACFDYLRFVSWGDMGLLLVFADLMVNEAADHGADDYYLQVPPNLQGYSYGGGDTGLTLTTAEVITTGSTVADLQDAYGDAVEFHSHTCGEVPEYTVTDPNSANGGMFGGLLGGTDWETFEESGYLNPDATVESIRAGAKSSC